MVRSLTILLYFCHLVNAHGQSQTAIETVNNYSVGQKRLLVLSTAAFTNLITQNNLDRDSVVQMACRITGLPFLMAYEEDYDSLSAGTDFINAGKITEAVQLLNTLKGEQRIQLLSQLGIWYLHKPGTIKKNLDSANYYIQNALTLDTIAKSNLRYIALTLLGEYYRQTGDEPESKKILWQIISSSQQEGNKIITADAFHCLGKLHKEIDSADFSYLNNSLALYQQLHFREKEIELLWDIAEYHLKHDMNLFKADLTRMLALQQSIGYRHSLFAENLLAFVLLQEAKLSETLEHAKRALENMKWSGISAVEGAFYGRIGSIYHSFRRYQEAEVWFKKAIELGTQETHVFWYKSLFHLVPLLVSLNRTSDALSILQQVSRKTPPLTTWEKGQVFTTMAYCCRILKNDQLADENYTSFLRLLGENPDMDPYGEFLEDYKVMVEFYLSKSNVKKARLVVERGLVNRKSVFTDDLNNYLLFKIDSATGNYRSALNHYIKHKYYVDTKKEAEQRMAFEGLTLKYGAEKKDNDIKLLQKDKQLQGTLLLQAKNTRNWILGGLALLLIIIGLLFHQYRNKQKSNRLLQLQKEVIDKSNHGLQQLNEQQTKLLTEKDWLVKEIHHRVKNNLQMVVSLLNAQTEFLTHPSARDAIKESRERMQAIAIIHQKLYQLENSTQTNMRSYINELIDNIKNSFADSERIHFKVDVTDVGLDISQSVPLGLILNEAITNAIKYAYPKNEKGLIKISLNHLDNDRLQLKIADSGKGLPVNVDIKHSNSLGMQLIRLFSEQLEGDLYFINNVGLEITLNFRATGYHEAAMNKIIA